MKRTFIALVFLSVILGANGSNLGQCLSEFHNRKFRNATIDDGRDNDGNPVSTFANATALTYLACARFCGTSQETHKPSWVAVSEQFSAWLLPWFALLSQLPFGAMDHLDDVGSIVLTVGSPALAGFSLAITVMDTRWIAQRFSTVRSPTAEMAACVLSRLHQSPLRAVEGEALIDLVGLRENDPWWEAMSVGLDAPHTWSIATAFSVSWVIIAYVLTVVDSFPPDPWPFWIADGEGIGSQWLFLLVVVVGWLQSSPQCDARTVAKVFRDTEGMVFARNGSTAEMTVERLGYSSQLPLELLRDIHWQNSLRRDEFRAPPIFNYARALPATLNVMKVFNAYHRVEEMEDDEIRVSSIGIWNSGILWRIILSSIFAMCLQCGTTGAAVVVVYLTPTVGLGCHSMSFLIYGGIATLIWFFMLLSALFTFEATRMYESHAHHTRLQRITRFLLKWTAILLRCTCKLAATANALWILLVSFFQFTDFLDRCWCDSNVLMRGVENAYVVIQGTYAEFRVAMEAWIGGVVLGVGSALVFWYFVASQLNPPVPKPPRK